MKRYLILALLILGSVSYANAQTPVVTQPYTAFISDNSKSITTTNTFQTALLVSTNTTGRVDCIIQNNSAAAKMYLHFGNTAPSAITPDSLQLTAGSIFRCNNGGVVIKDKILITGTSGDSYFATQE